MKILIEVGGKVNHIELPLELFDIQEHLSFDLTTGKIPKKNDLTVISKANFKNFPGYTNVMDKEESTELSPPADDTPPITPEPSNEQIMDDEELTRARNKKAEKFMLKDQVIAKAYEKFDAAQKEGKKAKSEAFVLPKTPPKPKGKRLHCNICGCDFFTSHAYNYHLVTKTPCNKITPDIIGQGSSGDDENEEEDARHRQQVAADDEPLSDSNSALNENEGNTDAENNDSDENVESDNESVSSNATESHKSTKSLNETAGSPSNAEENEKSVTPTKRTSVRLAAAKQRPARDGSNSSEDRPTTSKRRPSKAKKKIIKREQVPDDEPEQMPRKARKRGGGRPAGSLRASKRLKALDDMTPDELDEYLKAKKAWLAEGKQYTPDWANKERDPECFLFCQVCDHGSRMHSDGPASVYAHWLRHYRKQFFLQEVMKGWYPMYSLFEDDGATQLVRCPREGQHGCKEGTSYSHVNHDLYTHFITYHVDVDAYIDTAQGLPRASYKTKPNPVAAYKEGIVGPGPEFTQGEWNASSADKVNNIVPREYRPFQPFICDGKTVVWKENPNAPHNPDNHPQPVEHREGYKRLIMEYRSRMENIPRDRNLIMNIKYALDVLFGMDETGRPLYYDLDFACGTEQANAEAIRIALHEITRKGAKFNNGREIWPLIWRYARPGYVSAYTTIVRDTIDSQAGGRLNLKRPELDPDFERWLSIESNRAKVKQYVYDNWEEGDTDVHMLISRPYTEQAEHKEPDLDISIPSLESPDDLNLAVEKSTPTPDEQTPVIEEHTPVPQTVGDVINAITDSVTANKKNDPKVSTEKEDQTIAPNEATETEKLKEYFQGQNSAPRPFSPVTEMNFEQALKVVRKKVLTIETSDQGSEELRRVITMTGIFDKHFSMTSPLAFMKMTHADFALALHEYSTTVATNLAGAAKKVEETTTELTNATNAMKKSTEASDKASKLLGEWSDDHEANERNYNSQASKAVEKTNELAKAIKEAEAKRLELTNATAAANESKNEHVNFKQDIVKEFENLTKRTEDMVRKSIDEILPDIVKTKINSLAGDEWENLVKNNETFAHDIESLKVQTKLIASTEEKISTIVKTMDEYKGLINLSNDFKLTLKYYNVFKRYWSRLMAYSKLVTGLTLEDVYQGELILHVTDQDWDFLDSTTTEVVAAEDVIRAKMKDPNLKIDVATAQKNLLAAIDEQNKLDRARKEKRERTSKDAKVTSDDKDRRFKTPKLPSQVTVVKSKTSDGKNDAPASTKKSTRSRTPPPPSGGTNTNKATYASNTATSSTTKASGSSKSGSAGTKTKSPVPNKQHDHERSKQSKDNFQRNKRSSDEAEPSGNPIDEAVVDLVLSKPNRRKAFMDTTLISSEQFGQFEKRQQERIARNNDRSKRNDDQNEKIQNELEGVRERLRRQEKEKMDREREEEQIREVEKAYKRRTYKPHGGYRPRF